MSAILADALEAIIGAAFLDGGFTAARAMVERTVRPCSMPGKRRSSAYIAAPVARAKPSLRETFEPTEVIRALYPETSVVVRPSSASRFPLPPLG